VRRLKIEHITKCLLEASDSVYCLCDSPVRYQEAKHHRILRYGGFVVVAS